MKALSLAAVLAALAGAAHAQSALESLDLDGDGRVSLAEFSQVENDATLDRLDVDKDGRISRAEMKPVTDREPEGSDRQGRLDRMWARSDLNGDGFIDRDELDAAAQRRFERRDANKDGWLTENELSAQSSVRVRP